MPVLALPALLAGQLAAQSLNDALARIDKSAPQFKSMISDMKSDVHTAIVNDDTVDNGTMKLKRDKGVTLALIEFTGADAKGVAFDGKTVSIYYPKIKTEQIYDLGKNRGLLDQFLLLGFGSTSAELKSAYNISWKGSENVNGKPADHLQLLPKSPEALMHLKRVDLWIPQGSGIPVQQQFFTSASGDFRLVTYSNMKVNSSVEGSLKLNLPKGVHVERPTL